MHSPSSTAGPRASLRATALAALAVSTSLLLHALPVQAAEPAACCLLYTSPSPRDS